MYSLIQSNSYVLEGGGRRVAMLRGKVDAARLLRLPQWGLLSPASAHGAEPADTTPTWGWPERADKMMRLSAAPPLGRFGPA